MQTREELIQTLEQADTPSIRLFTLLKLKGLSPDDPLVLQQQFVLAEQEP